MGCQRLSTVTATATAAAAASRVDLAGHDGSVFGTARRSSLIAAPAADCRAVSYTNWDGGVRANAFVNGGFLPGHVRGTKLSGPSSYVHLCDVSAPYPPPLPTPTHRQSVSAEHRQRTNRAELEHH